MTNDANATVVMIRSEHFAFSASVDAPPDCVPGKDLARFVMRAMAALGIPPEFEDPVVGEGGWSWGTSTGRRRFVLFVHWAAVGNPPEDWWIIQPGLRKGIMRTLFGRPTQPNELASVCDVLHQVLDHHAAFSTVKWLTTKQFRNVY